MQHPLELLAEFVWRYGIPTPDSPSPDLSQLPPPADNFMTPGPTSKEASIMESRPRSHVAGVMGNGQSLLPFPPSPPCTCCPPPPPGFEGLGQKTCSSARLGFRHQVKQESITMVAYADGQVSYVTLPLLSRVGEILGVNCLKMAFVLGEAVVDVLRYPGSYIPGKNGASDIEWGRLGREIDAWHRVSVEPNLFNPPRRPFRNLSSEPEDPYAIADDHRDSVNIGLVEFIASTASRLKLSIESMPVAMYLLRRLALHEGDGPSGWAFRTGLACLREYRYQPLRVEKHVVTMCLLLAEKLLKDHHLLVTDWAMATGLDFEDLVDLEVLTLQALYHSTYICPHEWASHMRSVAQHVGRVCSALPRDKFPNTMLEQAAIAEAWASGLQDKARIGDDRPIQEKEAEDELFWEEIRQERLENGYNSDEEEEAKVNHDPWSPEDTSEYVAWGAEYDGAPPFMPLN